MKALLLILLMSGVAFAKETGNGGNALVCRNADGSIQSARLLDLFEGEELFYLEGVLLNYLLPRGQDDVQGNLRYFAEKIFPNSPERSEDLYKEFNRIRSIFTPIRPGTHLEKIDDSYHPFRLTGCQVEQVANYRNNSQIMIDSSIYKHFSQLDQIALIIHEALYLRERKYGKVDNSMFARYITAVVMSTLNPFGVEEVKVALGQKALTCLTGEEAKRPTVFTLKEIDSAQRTWEISFERMNGHRVYATKKGIVTGLDDFEYGTDPVESDFIRGGRTMNTVLQSELMGNEEFSLHLKDVEIDALQVPKSNPTKKYKKTDLHFKWSGYFPEDELDWTKAYCFPLKPGLF